MFAQLEYMNQVAYPAQRNTATVLELAWTNQALTLSSAVSEFTLGAHLGKW